MTRMLVIVLSSALLLTGCLGQAVVKRSEDLPSPAAGGATCGGSTIAQGPKQSPLPASSLGTAHSGIRSGILFSAPSAEDRTAQGLYVINADGGNRREIIHGFFDAEAPVVSPDGKLVAFRRQSASLEHPQLAVAGVDGSSVRTLYQSAHYVNSISWSPDGQRIAFLADSALMTVEVKGDSNPQRIAVIHNMAADVLTDGVAWSPDGSAIAFIGDFRAFPVLDLAAPDGSRRRELVTTTGSFAWSPRGDSIAFTYGGISVVASDGGHLRHLVATPVGTVVTALSWSPGGQWLVFHSGDSSVAKLCRVSTNGGGLVELADCIPQFAPQPQQFSKDGAALVFVQAIGGDCALLSSTGLAVVPVGGGVVSPLTHPGGSPQWLGD